MNLWSRMRLRNNLSNNDKLASVHAVFAIDDKSHVTPSTSCCLQKFLSNKIKKIG